VTQRSQAIDAGAAWSPAPAPRTAPADASARRAGRPARVWVLAALLLALPAAVGLALSSGAYPIPLADVVRLMLAPLAALAALAGFESAPVAAQHAAILYEIRLPRIVLALLTGAGLAAAGALLQGLFRNPLADPTLIGTATGAALAAAFVIVLGATALPGATRLLGAYTLPLAAFAGSLAATALVYRIGQVGGVVSLPVMLLAGIAINAACGAALGLLTYIASDQQLRTIAFWNLGSLGAATWPAVAAIAPPVALALAVALGRAQPLNALALGEERARHLGVDTTREKRLVIVLAALLTGCLVAITGVIGFIGLVAPHLIRLACGPDHRHVLPGAMLLGALLVLMADLVARTAVAPAELPIGVLTALLGAPVFLGLLLARRHGGGWVR
jgi:iron complex transport system permease protein